MTRQTIKQIARAIITVLLISLLPLALITIPPLMVGRYITTETLLQGIAASLLFGIGVYFVTILTRLLQEVVGTFTGFAALAGGSAIAGTALALVLPTCPGAPTGQACAPAEGATWGFSIAMLVILFVLGWVIITGSFGFLKWAGGKAKNIVTTKDDEDNDEPKPEADEDKAVKKPSSRRARKRAQRKEEASAR